MEDSIINDDIDIDIIAFLRSYFMLQNPHQNIYPVYDKKKIAAKLKCITRLSISIKPVNTSAILEVELSTFKSLY